MNMSIIGWIRKGVALALLRSLHQNTHAMATTENGQTEVLHSHLSAMDSPTKPWYLSTKAIFRIVRKAIGALPTNPAEFDQALFGINALAKLIGSKTEAGILVINLEKAQDLIDKLDQIRSDQFVVLSDGLDDARGRLSVALRSLIARITEQQAVAASYLSQKSAEMQGSDQNVVKVVVAAPVEPSGWFTSGLLGSVVQAIKQRFPQTFGRASAVVESGRERAVTTANSMQSYCCHSVQAADVKVAVASSQLLNSAQPYVHQALERSAPAVAAVVARSQPLLQSVGPLVQTVAERAQRVQGELLSHPTLSTFVSPALASAQQLLLFTQTYCLSGAPHMQAALLGLALPDLPDLPALPEVPDLELANKAGEALDTGASAEKLGGLAEEVGGAAPAGGGGGGQPRGRPPRGAGAGARAPPPSPASPPEEGAP